MAKKSINIRAGFDLKAFSTSSQNLTRSLQKTGAKMKSIGKSMSMSLTAPIVGLGAVAVKTFADFEQSMAKVQAISGATGKDFEALTQKAKDLGISTRFAASEVSELMLNYSKLGFSSDEIQKITGATLDLALATGEDLARSAEIAGATLRAFGLDATEMVHLTDVMANSFSSSALDLDSFAESMKYVAPIAKAAGVSLEETSAMLSLLANNGIKGSQAGTALKKIISEIGASGKPTNQALKELAATGLDLADAQGEVGDRAKAALLILADGSEQIDPLTEAYKTQTNVAKDMAKIMDDTLEGSMMRLKSAAEGLGISFGEVMAPAVSAAAEIISGIAMKFSNLDESTKKTIVVIAAIAAAIGPLIFALGALNVAMAVIAANPITLSIIAITGAALALNAALSQTVKLNDDTKKSVGRLSMANNVLETSIKKINDLKAQSAKLSKTEIANTIKQTKATIKKTAADLQEQIALKKVLATKLEGKIERAITTSQGKGGDRIAFQLASIERMQAQVDAYTSSIDETSNKLEELKTISKTLETDLKNAGKVEIAAPKIPTPKIPTTTEASAGGKDLTDKQQKKRIGKLKGELFEIQSGIKKIGNTPIEPVVNVEGIKTSLANVKQEGVTIFEQMGREMGVALSTGLKDLATEGLVSFGQFLGDVMSGGDMTIQDFGRGLLDSIGKFMGQFGEAMIAMGIAQTLLNASIASMNPAAAIIGGVALVAAGAAISNLSKKGIDKGGGVTDTGGGGGGVNFNNQNGTPGYMMQLETKVSGRDIILVQERERAFKR